MPFLDAGPPLDRPDGLPIRGNQQYWLGPNDLVIVPTIREGDGLPGLGMYDVHTGSFTPIPDSVISYPSDGIPRDAVTYSGKGAQIYWSDSQLSTTVYRANIDGTGLQKVADLESFRAALSPDLTAVAYSHFSGPANAVYDTVTLYTGAAAIEIDSRPVVGGVGIPFSAVWRPRP